MTNTITQKNVNISDISRPLKDQPGTDPGWGRKTHVLWLDWDGLPAGRAGNSSEEGRGAPGTHRVAITEGGGLCGLAVNFTISSSASV